MAINLELVKPEIVRTVSECEEAAHECRRNRSGPVVFNMHERNALLKKFEDWNFCYRWFEAGPLVSFPLDYRATINDVSDGHLNEALRISGNDGDLFLSMLLAEDDEEAHFDGMLRIPNDEEPKLFFHYTCYGSATVSFARMKADSVDELCLNTPAGRELFYADLHQEHNAGQILTPMTLSLKDRFLTLTETAGFVVTAGDVILFPGRGEYNDNGILWPMMHDFSSNSVSRAYLSTAS